MWTVMEIVMVRGHRMIRGASSVLEILDSLGCFDEFLVVVPLLLLLEEEPREEAENYRSTNVAIASSHHHGEEADEDGSVANFESIHTPFDNRLE